MGSEVTCGNQRLDCTAVVDWVRNHSECTKYELMDSNAFRNLVRTYAEMIKVQHELSWAVYEWFVDVVLGQLITSGALSVKFGVWGMKNWR